MCGGTGDDEDDEPLSPSYLDSSPGKSSAIRDATDTESRRSSSNSLPSVSFDEGQSTRQPASSKEKGKEVEDEEEADDDEREKDRERDLNGKEVSAQRQLSLSDSDEAEETEMSERSESDGLPQWSHMSIRRMLQEVKKRAKTSGSSSWLSRPAVPPVTHRMRNGTDKGIVTMMSITGDGSRRKKEEQDELLMLIDDLIYLLKRLPEQYKVNSYVQLLYQMEQVFNEHRKVASSCAKNSLMTLQDYQRRRIYLSFLCTEKIEMLQSFEVRALITVCSQSHSKT